MIDSATKHRSLCSIADDILKHWPKPNYAAAPYISAMQALDSVKDHYGMDSGKSIVLYFLSNAAMWRGDHAKRIKAELSAMVKQHGARN